MTNYRLLFLLLFTSSLIYSQDNFVEEKHTSAYRSWENVEYKNDLPALVIALTKDSKNEIEKANEIFKWITNNIKYDYKLFNRNKRIIEFKCKNKVDCEQKVINWKNKNIQKILCKKKAICSGYSDLFKKMCDIAGIDCIVIDGYIKNNVSQIGRMGILDHSWNAIIVDNEYYYLDVTWAAGYCTKKENGKLNSFVKHYNDYYWLTPIDKLSRNHFPKDTLTLVNSKYNKKLFKQNPYIENSILPSIEIFSPNSGIINSCIGDTIRFSFAYSKALDKLQINTNIQRNPKVWSVSEGKKNLDQKALGKQKYISYNKQNDVYSFQYIIEKNSVRFIEILFDYELALKYLVKVE